MRTHLALALSLLSLAPSAALAQSRADTSFSLEYRVPAGDGCPSESDFRSRLAALLGEDSVRADSPRVVRVEVVRERSLHGGSLSLHTPGRDPLTRPFAPARVSCRDLVDSIALSLGLALQELAHDAPPQTTPEVTPTPTPSARVEDILVPVIPPEQRVTSIAPQAPDPPPPPPRAHGLELSLRMGAGSFTVTDDSAWLGSDYSSGTVVSNRDTFSGTFALDARVGWRFDPHFSVGVRGSMQLFDMAQANRSSTAWTLGADLRWYMFPGVDRWDVDPWFSVGIDGLARFETSGSIDTTLNGFAAEQSQRAIALPMMLGVDVHVAPRLAVGVSGMLSWWIHFETCARSSVSTLASDLCSQGNHFSVSTGSTSPVLAYTLRDNTQWSIAFDARYTLDL